MILSNTTTSSSSEEFLVEEKVSVVSKKVFEGLGIIGGIDRGCTLTKVLFSTERDADNYNLHFALFLNKNFETALDYLKQKGFIVQQSGAKLHVTGAGCDIHRDVIQQKLGMQTLFIDEILTQSRGIHWLIKNVDDAELCYPPAELNAKELAERDIVNQNEMLQKYKDSLRNSIGDSDNSSSSSSNAKFPCIVMFVGSGAGILKVEDNGQTDIVGSVYLAGKSFLGFSRLLLGTDDYEEIIRLAEAGDRCNVDTQIREVLADDPNSPYGQFPSGMPLFSFGKAADHHKNLSDIKREDVAASLVASFAYSMLFNVIMAATTTKTRRVYLGGNFFRANVIRKEVSRAMTIYGGEENGVIDLKFVKTGHSGAIGAMVSQPGDMEKFMMMMHQAEQQQQQQQQKQQQQQQ